MTLFTPKWATETEAVLVEWQARREKLLAQLGSVLPEGHPLKPVVIEPVILSDGERRGMKPSRLSLADLKLKFQEAV